VHVDPVLIFGRGIGEVVGDAEHGGQLIAGLRIEIGVAAAAVDRPVPVSDVRERQRIIESDRNVAGCIDHEVVHAEIPAQRGLRLEVADATRRTRHRRPAEHPHRPQDCLIDGDLVTSIGNKHADLKLPPEHRACKHIARDAQQQIVLHADVNFERRGYLGRHTGNRDLPRDRNVASALDRRMIVDLGIGESLRQRRSGECAVGAGHPEAYAALIRACESSAAQHGGECEHKRARLPAIRRI
jgi:hypothetical protein